MDKNILEDPQRLAALRKYSLNDAQAEVAFDRLTRLASKMLNAPIALVNLINDTVQYCKSAYGIAMGDANLPVSASFCANTITMGKPFVIEDVTDDPQFANNPMVAKKPHLRSYLGIPLQTEDHHSIGTLCVLDFKPRQWSKEEIQMLEELTATVMMEIDLRARLSDTQETAEVRFDTDSTPPHIPLHELNQFGRYEIVEHIDSGGMCDVYLCKHEHLQVPVAIKRLRYNFAQDKIFRARFELEGNIITSLRHPNIIRVFEVGNEGDNYYMVMEYIMGQTLKTFIKERAPIPLPTVIEIGKDIAEALDYAHSQQVIHRDVKSSNVMLREKRIDGGKNIYQATLMDFGIAKMVDIENQLTGENAIGTIDYMAPEQIEESASVSAATDIYAFGIVLYEMLTGRLPYEANNLIGSIFKRMNDPMPDPRQHVSDLPVHVGKALEKALAKCPDERYSTAIELVAALEQY